MKTGIAAVALACCLSVVGCSDDDSGNNVPVEYVHPNACAADSSCEANPRFDIQEMMSLATGADENPEIVRVIPGTVNRAVLASSASKKLTFIDYGAASFSFAESYSYDLGGTASEMTSMTVSPDGKFLVITDARADCAKGFLHIVDLDVNHGTIINSIEVGYNPDSVAISKDGRWLVSADEDDREDRPCKPADRHGGSVSVIDLSVGLELATVVKTIPTDWDVDAEPEGVKIAPDNDTVLVALQETSQLAFFRLSEINDADFAMYAVINFVDDLGVSAGEPDGIALNEEGDIALVGLEKTDSFAMISVTDATVLALYSIEDNGDLPSSYNRDLEKSTKRMEPEEVALIKAGGQVFALMALQESHAVLVYNVTDPTEPFFDSVAPVGIGYQAEDDAGLNEKSEIGSEGLAICMQNAITFIANEREGSVTMLTSSFTQVVP